MEQNKAIGHGAALLTILIWGTTFISTKVLLVDFQPIEILFFRFVMGLLALLIVYPHRNDRQFILTVCQKRQTGRSLPLPGRGYAAYAFII